MESKTIAILAGVGILGLILISRAKAKTAAQQQGPLLYVSAPPQGVGSVISSIGSGIAGTLSGLGFGGQSGSFGGLNDAGLEGSDPTDFTGDSATTNFQLSSFDPEESFN